MRGVPSRDIMEFSLFFPLFFLASEVRDVFCYVPRRCCLATSPREWDYLVTSQKVQSRYLFPL